MEHDSSMKGDGQAIQPLISHLRQALDSAVLDAERYESPVWSVYGATLCHGLPAGVSSPALVLRVGPLGLLSMRADLRASPRNLLHLMVRCSAV